MISGANENELEIANARAEILLMCGSETLKVIDKYYKQQLESYENMRKETIEFVESMEYCGQEDYFYDNKAKDPCGNDNTFNDSKNKLLNILNKVGGSDE